jgi:general secretion pathway protein E
LSPRLAKVVVSRIKIMAGLDIAERRLPQDGRARVDVDGARYDLRVATLPVSHGETVVVRFLLDTFADVSLAQVGFSDTELAQIRACLAAPFGLALIVGPTGAGKSTTLAGALAERNRPGVKLISIEDPVEYQIDGVTQIAVRPAIGLTFATALRSILRNDPDVIVVGELRDSETAEMATNAALTGHLVLATLHANDAASAIPRLLDLGVDASLIRSTLRLVIAQRLVRKLCVECREPLGDGAWSAKGCSRCEGTGYAGRTGIFEQLMVDAAAAERIISGCTASDFSGFTFVDGAPGLRASAMAKVRAGMTTLAEVHRVMGP